MALLLIAAKEKLSSRPADQYDSLGFRPNFRMFSHHKNMSGHEINFETNSFKSINVSLLPLL